MGKMAAGTKREMERLAARQGIMKGPKGDTGAMEEFYALSFKPWYDKRGQEKRREQSREKLVGKQIDQTISPFSIPEQVSTLQRTVTNKPQVLTPLVGPRRAKQTIVKGTPSSQPVQTYANLFSTPNRQYAKRRIQGAEYISPMKKLQGLTR